MSWRSTTPDDLPLAALWALAATCAIALAPLAPAFASLLPACPLHAWTGFPCLTCGSTRAAMSLARGDWQSALGINPLAAIGVSVAVLGGLLAPAWVVIRAPLPVMTHPRWPRIAVIATLSANWIYLIARGV